MGKKEKEKNKREEKQRIEKEKKKRNKEKRKILKNKIKSKKKKKRNKCMYLFNIITRTKMCILKLVTRLELYGPLGFFKAKHIFIWKAFNQEIWKLFTISSLLKKNFIWPDETNQDHSGDLMEQSATCQIWLMCPFGNMTGDLIPTSTDKSSAEDVIANTSCGKIFCQLLFILPLNWGDFLLFNPFASTSFE